MPLPGSTFNPGGSGYGSGIGMGGYGPPPSTGNPGYARMDMPHTDASGMTSYTPEWANPDVQNKWAQHQSELQAMQTGNQQQQLANMFRQLLMGVLFGTAPGGMGGQPGQGGQQGFQPASQIPGFDPNILRQLMGRGQSSSPFNPNFGSPQMPPMGAMMGGGMGGQQGGR